MGKFIRSLVKLTDNSRITNGHFDSLNRQPAHIINLNNAKRPFLTHLSLTRVDSQVRGSNATRLGSNLLVGKWPNRLILLALLKVVGPEGFEPPTKRL